MLHTMTRSTSRHSALLLGQALLAMSMTPSFDRTVYVAGVSMHPSQAEQAEKMARAEAKRARKAARREQLRQA